MGVHDQRLITCLVGDKYTEEDNDRLRPDFTYRGEFRTLPGVWNKLAMLRLHGSNRYLDLDTVIRGPVNWPESGPRVRVGLDYWTKRPDRFNLDTRFNSSVMVWGEPQEEIWERFMRAPDLYMRKYKGIDRFLWWECRDLVDTFEDGLYEVYGKPREDTPAILTYSGYSDKESIRRGTLEDH